VRGVLAAAAAKRRTGGSAAVGFAVSPEVNPSGGAFWPAVAELGGPEFAAAVDYAGLDMYRCRLVSKCECLRSGSLSLRRGGPRLMDRLVRRG
jgi:hypothetical protein